MYEIQYETHIHHLNGTYDKKIGEGVWKMNSNSKINCRPYVFNQNKIVALSPDDIIKNNQNSIGNFTLTEGKINDEGYYIFEKIKKGGVKKLILILLFLGLTSCVYKDKYTLDITYVNGERDTVVYILNNYPVLNEGDLESNGEGTIMSGVRKFKVLKQDQYKK